MLPRWENSNGDSMENLTMLVRERRHVNVDGSVTQIRKYSTYLKNSPLMT